MSHWHLTAVEPGGPVPDHGGGTTTLAPDRPSLTVRHGAKALVTTADRVLVVREHHADGSPFWTLPGGGAHQGESTVTAVERELAEELRCQCVVGDRVTTFTYAHTSRDAVSLYAVHECRLLSEPEPVRDEGIAELCWSSPSSLPTRTLPQVQTLVERALDD